LGRALAEALASRGARLLLAARRQPELEALASELKSRGVEASFLAGDVADPEFRRQLVDAAAAHWGALDVLINNAGVSAHGRFADGDPSTLRRILDVNFVAPAELTRLALPLLRNGRQAAVVNVGSILGHRGAPYNSEYSASKAALRAWSEALRAELAAEGVDVLLVSPGTLATEFFDHLLAKRAALPWGKARGITPQAAAEQTVRALERNRREIFPNWRGRALVLANRLAPGLVDRVMAKYGRSGDN
jgi:short-subunit dehydrogenase